MSQRETHTGRQPSAGAVRSQLPKCVAGVDLARIGGADQSSVIVRKGTRTLLIAGGQSLVLDREWINSLNAGRKPDREQLAMAFDAIASAHGATVKRRESGPNPGWRGCEITLTIGLNGVGAMVDFSNLHGGDHGLIHWYNDHDSGDRVTRNFSFPFAYAVAGATASSRRTHHKATSGGADWYALAMQINNGLLLAARGEAFEQPSAT